VVLDNGFTLAQRALLSWHCRLMVLPPTHASPHLLKPFPCFAQPTATVVIIDSDMILTRPLGEMLAQAEEGKICVYAGPERDRWFAEWEPIFGLCCAPRHQVYVNSGFIAFSTRHWPHLLQRWWQVCRRIASWWRDPGLCVGQLDQDAFNAVLMSEVPPEAMALQPDEEAPNSAWFAGVRVVDESSLTCSYRGHVTTLLHQSGNPKPWQERGWLRVRRNAYTRLLYRVLLDPDVALQLTPEELPFWLRPGIANHLSLRGLDIMNAPTFQRGVKWLLPQRMLLPVQHFMRGQWSQA
jgi:hypothetical protein